jgi:ribosomal protein S18 acetylase RimI-like enzyme
VHPDFQRRGVGSALLDWGLSHARFQGEKVYLEASEFGKGLYLKNGFKKVGELVVDEEGDRAMFTYMLWDPVIVRSADKIE